MVEHKRRGTNMRVMVAVLFLMFFVTPANAEDFNKEQRQEIWQTAQDLAECGAVYEAMSRALQVIDRNLAISFHNLGNGAVMAASVAGSYILEPKKAISLAENVRESNQPRYAAMIRNGSGEVKEALDKCHDLNPLQEALVQEGRKVIYGFLK